MEHGADMKGDEVRKKNKISVENGSPKEKEGGQLGLPGGGGKKSHQQRTFQGHSKP